MRRGNKFSDQSLIIKTRFIVSTIFIFLVINLCQKEFNYVVNEKKNNYGEKSNNNKILYKNGNQAVRLNAMKVRKKERKGEIRVLKLKEFNDIIEFVVRSVINIC